MTSTLSDMLDPMCIDLDLEGKRKPDIIKALVKVLGRGGQVSDLKKLTSDVIEREKVASTGIGSGIAIPHAMSDTVDKTLLAFGLKKDGARFDSVDNRPVTLFFLLVGPSGSHAEHLKVLSRIARYLHDERFCRALHDALTPEDVIAAIEEKDRNSP
jgi:fructose-specific phosphotransferase system IIA component